MMTNAQKRALEAVTKLTRVARVLLSKDQVTTEDAEQCVQMLVLAEEWLLAVNQAQWLEDVASRVQMVEGYLNSLEQRAADVLRVPLTDLERRYEQFSGSPEAKAFLAKELSSHPPAVG